MSAEEKRVRTIQESMLQNAEFFGFDLCDQIDIGGEVVEIMYRELLDAEAKRRVDQVYQEFGECDRHMIVMDDKSEVPGPFKDPRMKDGELFDLDERVSVAVWGQEKYDRYVAAGGPPGLLLMTWSRMRSQISRRMNEDSKSS